MFQTVLVPLDGSRLAEAALGHAAAVAHAFHSRLQLVRVVPMRQRAGSTPLDVIDRRLAQVEARSYLDALATELSSRGMAVDVAVTEGQPADRILEIMRADPPDLVILTTHGAGGSSEFRVSGTASKMISLAGTSVLLVPTTTDTPVATGYQRVLVATDCSRESDCALTVGAELARVANAELVLLHVVAVPETMDRMPLGWEHRELVERLVAMNRHAAETWLEEAKARLVGGSDLRVRTRVAVAPGVAQAVAEVAEGERPDLVVLAAQGKSGGTRWLYGAVATQTLAEARRPLLIVQGSPRSLEEPHVAAIQRRSIRA